MTKDKINFLEELSKLKKPVWHALDNYLSTRAPHGHYEMMREYPLRQGKYLRPGLLLLAIQMFGGDKKLGILPAAAIQASEEWLLVHDDIEDHSDYRRHKPTLHKMHGEELAINAGDGLQVIMWQIVADSVRQFKDDRGWKIFDKMNDIMLKTTEGQYLELSWIREKRVTISEKEYLDMVKRKTSYYSIIGPLQIGAMIAGASVKEIKKIEDWGTPLGYAFQILNDYTSVNDSIIKHGKGFAEDITEGKRTLILSHLLSHANPKEKSAIVKIYKKSHLEKTKSEKKYILELINKYGSANYAKDMAQSYGKKAEAAFLRHTAHLKDIKAKKTILAGIKIFSSL